MTFDGVRLEGIDFSGSRLTDLRFFGATVDNCRFDRVRFDDLGLWATKLYRCSFDGAGLRDAVLGGWEDGIGDRYEATSFVGADLRGIVCSVAEFIDVDFSQAELAGIDFDASSFVRCTFAGVLREIIFWRKPPDSEVTTENPMQDVDFGGAELHDVEFRQLSLERVTLPSGDGHVVVRNYRCVLERGMDSLSGTHAFAAVLANQIRWAHPDRKIGIWHRDELGTTDAERNEVADILIELDAECAGNA
ncbi:hypothetical protein DMB66_19050 [Actinoplanes sp. ATCC 53533]|nr:hypothetical protein DMB66_19050 [Actinoplanes sp. ATCC 53533]